ncbi:LysR family transcriptional regulator [Burkholderia dolosa]|jgi:DNA-binding transcriptional LysR family regulator|uniref:LysR family transcriptional regulator n=1 Tax=Burkholderia dolosa TaxID=152500 RepID=UPI001B98251A|nr:LysR family transcriptional regulator [Burkholderia dolosa]MBR8302454.1 LysR family transcriptional regulator [Burkholderia dolosa]
MDHFNAIRLFLRIVERRSFTLATEDLGMPRSTGTEAIKELERHVGVRLLERTTRQVTPTLEGQAYYERCAALLSELDETEMSLREGTARGLVRVGAPGRFARHFLAPALPALMEQNPHLQVRVAQTGQTIDLIRDGVDCVVQMGPPKDSTLIGRQVATLDVVTCASPSYVARFGLPSSPDELEGRHEMVGYFSSATACFFPLSFGGVGGSVRTLFLPARVSVTDDDTHVAMAKLGFGLIQAPRYQIAEEIGSGQLVPVLPDFPVPPLPAFLLYPQNKQLSPRVRVVIEWIVATLATSVTTEASANA